jgi:hypothetical protein
MENNIALMTFHQFVDLCVKNVTICTLKYKQAKKLTVVQSV